jgi:hypothetical protein
VERVGISALEKFENIYKILLVNGITMALSQQVEESLKEAQGNLRNALAFAARNEKPFVSKQISDMIMNIESIIAIDAMSDKIEDMLKNKNDDGSNGPSIFGFGGLM